MSTKILPLEIGPRSRKIPPWPQIGRGNAPPDSGKAAKSRLCWQWDRISPKLHRPGRRLFPPAPPLTWRDERDCAAGLSQESGAVRGRGTCVFHRGATGQTCTPAGFSMTAGFPGQEGKPAERRWSSRANSRICAIAARAGGLRITGGAPAFGEDKKRKMMVQNVLPEARIWRPCKRSALAAVRSPCSFRNPHDKIFFPTPPPSGGRKSRGRILLPHPAEYPRGIGGTPNWTARSPWNGLATKSEASGACNSAGSRLTKFQLPLVRKNENGCNPRLAAERVSPVRQPKKLVIEPGKRKN